jgi:hypothetical protein
MRFRNHKIAGLYWVSRDLLGPLFVHRKASQTPPPAPDPNVVANAQTGSNIDTQVGNMVGTNGPSGSTSYTQSGSYTDPNTGRVIPQWTQNTSLTPLGQSIFTGTQNAANSLTGTAQDLATQAGSTATKPLDFSGTNNNIIQGGPQALDKQTADALYGQSKSFLDPQWTQTQKDLTDQLSRQGIPVGSDAYNSAMTNFNNSKTQAYTTAQQGAEGAAVPAAAQMFGMALQGQNQNIGQQQTAQSNPLRLLSQIYGGAGGSPAQGGGTAAFADGGIPPVGQPSVVGERGPELFVPQQPGTVIPNHMLGALAQSGQQAPEAAPFQVAMEKAEQERYRRRIENASGDDALQKIKRELEQKGIDTSLIPQLQLGG